MQTKTQARAHARALVGAVAIGSTLSLALAGAYLVGGASRAETPVPVEQIAAGTAVIAPISNITAVTGGGMGGKPISVREAARMAAKSAVRSAFDVGPAARPYAGGSARDLDCLTTAVYYEARGESVSGQAAIAQVVLNRVRHPSFPKTVCGVVFQGAQARGCQFSFACNGAMHGRRNAAAWNRAHDIASKALGGFVATGVGSATHFHATRVAPGWAGMVRVAQIGAHVFYRSGGRAGRGGGYRSRDVQVASADAPQRGYQLMRTSSIEGGELTLASGEATPASTPAPLTAIAKPAEADAPQPVETVKPTASLDARPAAAVQTTGAAAS